MEPADPLVTALARLRSATERLEEAALAYGEKAEEVAGLDRQMQRMTADRSRLAAQLDSALVRQRELENGNREVSDRLAAAMERIRGVLDPEGT